METWPVSILPDPTLSYTSANSNSVIRSKFDTGRVRQRLRFTADTKTQGVRWTFDDIQFAVFQGWLKQRVANGADFFLMNLPLGDGIKQYQVRFVQGTYNASYQEPRWIVTVSLEIEDAPVLAPEIVDALIDLGSDIYPMFDAIDRLDELINVTLPARW